jgi:hypothetical protein
MITVEGKGDSVVASRPEKKIARKSFASLSPLMRELSDMQVQWLLRHCVDRHSDLNGKMGDWRAKMAKYERMSEDDYSDRRTELDEVNAASQKDIFHLQNDTLGTVSGFVDFHYAQAKDDIFGTRPWLAATPEGSDDADLADVITKHANWKLGYSDVENALHDALKISTWGGTAFVKASFVKDIETIKRTVPVAVEVKTGKDIVKEDGTPAKTQADLIALNFSEEQVEWVMRDEADTETVYANVTNGVIDYKDICFETTAPELTLRYTDVFCRFKCGLLDVMDRYNIPEEKKNDLLAAIQGVDESARDHRDESQATNNDPSDENTNPTVTLVEGFVRCAPIAGRLNRIHVIFAPDLHILFAADYLSNVTPGGILPVFPVRINRIPGRVFGRGYFEKYENTDKAIDRQFNLITYRNRAYAHVWTAFQPDALADDGEGEDIEMDPLKPHKLKPDKTIADLISFAAAPDNSARSENILNSLMQMAQMRSGITSAAQGELKGVPSAQTATGTRDLQSRGATIVKAPIDEQVSDITAIVAYDVLLIYANQDADETFAWGEGREAELLKIESNVVRGIRSNVKLTMTQAQNQRKYEAASQAIQTIMLYVQLPEMEKAAARYAFIQALNAIGFHNAEDIVRQPALDLPGILALLPPDVAPVVQQALAAVGLGAPPTENNPAPVEQVA